MEHLNKNLRYLRVRKRLSQNKLSTRIGIASSSISAYEQKRSTPKITTLLKYSKFFNRNLEELVTEDLGQVEKEQQKNHKGKELRILPILVDNQNKELVSLVPVKAAAGYLTSYNDIEFIGELPKFSLPFPELSENKTYRAFQIEGDSMLPVPSGAYIICEYVQDWELIKDNSCHVVISSDDGIVYKRIKKDLKNNQFIMQSDNTDYLTYELSMNRIDEVWKALGFVSFNL